jgi:isocitrate dehydrogenase
MKRTFERIAKEYSDIEAWHVIVDNCAHQLVKKPEQFDVIVTTNMNGDILSDLTSALVGGLGFAPSANLGSEAAIFEAVHGSAPKYAGKNVINPCAVLLSGVMMLRHIGEHAAATKIEHAVMVTMAEGKVRTGDVVGYDKGKNCSTEQFADEIIKNLGKEATGYAVRNVKPLVLPTFSKDVSTVTPKARRVVGADIFVEANLFPAELGPKIAALAEGTPFKLKMISNRGTQVFPDKGTLIDCVDQYRCRFMLREAAGEGQAPDVLALVAKIGESFRWAHIEMLQEFDGAPGYTKAQGED